MKCCQWCAEGPWPMESSMQEQHSCLVHKVLPTCLLSSCAWKQHRSRWTWSDATLRCASYAGGENWHRIDTERSVGKGLHLKLHFWPEFCKTAFTLARWLVNGGCSRLKVVISICLCWDRGYATEPMHVDVGMWKVLWVLPVSDSPLSVEYRCLCIYLEKAGLEMNFSLQHSTSLFIF